MVGGCSQPAPPIAVDRAAIDPAPTRPVIVEFSGERFMPKPNGQQRDLAFAVWEYEAAGHPRVRNLEYRDLLAVDNVRPETYDEFGELELVARQTQVRHPSRGWVNHGLHCTWYPDPISLSIYEMGVQTYTGRDGMGFALPPRDHEW